MRKYLRISYLLVLAILCLSTLAALYDGGYHIAGGIIAGIAFASILTSFVPYFLAMHFLKKFQEQNNNVVKYKVLGLVFYSFCFPVKIWIIISNVNLLINGGERWAFG
jgi:hypothetical protein